MRRFNFTLGLIGLVAVATSCSNTNKVAQSTDPATTSVTATDEVQTSEPTTVPVTQAPTTTTPSEPTLCIRSNIDFAALRLTPDLRAELLAEIPPGSCDVTLLEFEMVRGSGFEWVHVRWDGIAGYTAADNAESVPTMPGTDGHVVGWEGTSPDDPEFIFTQIVNWANVDGGEYAGEYSDPTCVAAYGPIVGFEAGFTGDLDGATAALDSLSIPISNELREHLERVAAIYRDFREDIFRIQNVYFQEGDTEAAAKADPAYDTVAAAFIEYYTNYPEWSATSLLYEVCGQYQLGE